MASKKRKGQVEAQKVQQKRKQDDCPISEDENEIFVAEFDCNKAWDEILHIPGGHMLVLDVVMQRDIELEVGINVSDEFPWKQVKLRSLRDAVFRSMINGDKIQKKFAKLDLEDKVLIGYIAKLSEENDTFIAFENDKAATQAVRIIQKIEEYNRALTERALVKKGRCWKSAGSEKEIIKEKFLQKFGAIDVEYQSKYPRPCSKAKFQHRFANDVRDGYIELVPGTNKYENITRKRMNIAIQSGNPKVDLSQQTDPPFPTNAWSQYLYEIFPDENALDNSDDEHPHGKKPSGKGSAQQKQIEVKKKTVELSEQVDLLLKILDYNQIDLCRMDYMLVVEKDMPQYIIPTLKNTVNFADISLSVNRYVGSLAWYPFKTGLLVASYTFTTINSYILEKIPKTSPQATVLEPNTILMWCLNDALNYKLQFESPREITCLSFCPYDSHLLVGGACNGQIIFWDFQDSIEYIDEEEILSASQIRHRNIIKQFLVWVKPLNRKVLICPTAISALKTSQTGPIRVIRWLDQHHYLSITGQTYVNSTNTYRYFATLSLDGTIAFWNLDNPVDQRRRGNEMKSDLPEQLAATISEYKKYDKVLKPQYIIKVNQPLTAFIMDDAIYEFFPYYLGHSSLDQPEVKNPIQVKAKHSKNFRQKYICATTMGVLQEVTWQGFDAINPDEVPLEEIKAAAPKCYGHVHDGPILDIIRNCFCRDIFITYGKYVFAIWLEDFLWTPILWRARPAVITNIVWSKERPCVFFLTRIDGTFEIWDLLARTDDACQIEAFGGSIITALSEGGWNLKKKALALGDYNSYLRMFSIPSSYTDPVLNEKEQFQQYVEKERERKLFLKNWEIKWREKNADFIKARHIARKKVEEEKEFARVDAIKEKLKAEADEKQRQLDYEKRLLAQTTLEERLELKYKELQRRHLVQALMARHRIDPVKLSKETLLEKKNVAFQNMKKIALKENFLRIDQDIAEVRARLLPLEEDDLSHADMILESVKGIIKNSKSYKDYAEYATELMNQQEQLETLSFNEVIERGRRRRQNLSTLIGLNTERINTYQTARKQNELDQFVFMEPQDDDSATRLDMVPEKLT